MHRTTQPYMHVGSQHVSLDSSFNVKNLHNVTFYMQAINWLRQQWARGVNAVLADDKGLGRTATVITFLQCLRYFACTILIPGLYT